MGKQVGQRGLGRRRWAVFGKFPGRVALKDVRIESRWNDCMCMARASKYRGESWRSVWRRPRWLYDNGFGEKRCGVARDSEVVRVVGEAWEADKGVGSVEFNVKELES
jgi:hypothetical protein